jgi:hypothetical protein
VNEKESQVNNVRVNGEEPSKQPTRDVYIIT